MVAEREGEPERGTGPVPRDMPDQQAGAGEDPWEVRPGRRDEDTPGAEDSGEDASPQDADVPDTDEAGTGRRGSPRSGTVHPEHPSPDESPA
ncbi:MULTISPECIES: hypothetical protein [unclassified Streptomyces]|uniref:hypothetical protein n=1 Tax=unclassified Streptomyces TaxID=2593676 RepID=UPI0040410285